MNFFRKLFGKKPAAPTSLRSGTTEPSRPSAAPVSQPAQPAAAPADPSKDPNLIRVHDAYGREMFITRDAWRDSVLLGQLAKVRDQPAALAPLIIQSLGDGFAADILEAAQHLAKIDSDAERGHVLLAVTYLQLKRYNDAEATLLRFCKQHGETGNVLVNLAKIHSGRGHEARALETLWRGLNLDPNQANGLGWYEAIHREQSGPAASLEAYRRVAALPGAWRARLWLARERLEQRDLSGALALYTQALAQATRPVPADLLQQLSGDLGNHAHLPELLKFTAPHFDLAFHGLAVGNNLIKASLDLGQLDAARSLVDRLYALNRPDWKQHLAFWDTEIAKARASTADIPTAATMEVTLLTIEGPVWLTVDSPAAELLPAKPEHALVVAFLGGTADLGSPDAPNRVQLADGPGRLSRALPLYLAEQVEFSTDAISRTLVPWLVKPRPGFILGGVPWDDATASHHARAAAGEGPADYVVISHLRCHAEPWTIELRLLRTIDAACLATVTTTCTPTDPGRALPGLVRELLGHLAAHADIPAAPQEDTGVKYQVADFPSQTTSTYLLRLEQLLAVRTAALNPEQSPLNGEREILDGQLQLCLDEPDSVPVRLIFAHTLRAMQKVRPAILPEFRARVELLQKEKPLPEPTQSLTARILSETFAP